MPKKETTKKDTGKKTKKSSAVVKKAVDKKVEEDYRRKSPQDDAQVLSTWTQINNALQNLPVYSITKDNIKKIKFCQKIVLYRVDSDVPENIYAIRYDVDHACLWYCYLSPFDIKFIHRNFGSRFTRKLCSEHRLDVEKIDFDKSFVFEPIVKANLI